MNKHEIVFDILKNKMLFVSERCKHDDNKTSTFKNLSFLSKTSFIVIIRPFKFIVKNESNKNNFDINHFKNTSNKKRSISTPKTFKEKMIKKPNFIDIIEINASTYYHLTRNKKNKLFSLTMNKIYDISDEPLEIISQLQRNNRISINKSYSCDFETKYKKCYKLYISKNVQINNAETLTSQKVFNKFSINYYDYVNVFNKSQANILFSHRFYNYKLKFVKRANKNALFKNRIYSLSDHKFEQIKKYLNEHLKKEFIVLNYVLFISSILFAKKPNKGLRFYINYRKLNVIIKRNRYSISLINEILTKI